MRQNSPEPKTIWWVINEFGASSYCSQDHCPRAHGFQIPMAALANCQKCTATLQLIFCIMMHKNIRHSGFQVISGRFSESHSGDDSTKIWFKFQITLTSSWNLLLCQQLLYSDWKSTDWTFKERQQWSIFIDWNFIWRRLHYNSPCQIVSKINSHSSASFFFSWQCPNSVWIVPGSYDHSTQRTTKTWWWTSRLRAAEFNFKV